MKRRLNKIHFYIRSSSLNPFLFSSSSLSTTTNQIMSSDLNEDIFELTVRLEDTLIQQGFDEGYEEGLVSGREDARHLGLKLGFETGELMGFYKGCSFLWNSALRLDPNHFSLHLHKHLNDFNVLLDKFPLLDPEDEAKDGIKDDLRVKFNIICASLSMPRKQLEYKGYPNPCSNLDF